tara:strand:- start:850 stop:966 length:117 start_codon:yes stop_codon:yes gene_type:complete
VKEGNIEGVKQAIADGADANAKNEYGFKDCFCNRKCIC